MPLDHHPIRVAVGPAHAPSTGGPRGDGASPRPLDPGSAALSPLIDIHESPEGLILEADLPGVTEDSVSIELEDNVLTLHARVANPLPDGARPLYEEFHVADYFRSFILSDEVDRTRITAELGNGVLRLTLPRGERARSRRIEIKSS